MCVREWEVFFKLEMKFGSCSRVAGREVGVSIYRWSSKLAVGHIFSVWDRLNRPWQVRQTVCQSDCQTDWQTDLQTGQVDQDRLNRP
jgi:hypothetical protein